MKHKNILKNIHIALGFMLLSLSSCEHKPLETDEYTDLRISVRDAGYVNADNGSRATDNGFTTTFEEGDKIGIYLVDNEGTVLRSNVPFICAGNNLWYTPENSLRVKEFPVKIVAYYPYVEDAELEGKITPTAETASDFFATYINDLEITNQSTEELYRKADVMAYMKSISSEDDWLGTLDLSLEHLMGLAVINLPKTVTANKTNYYLSWDNSVKWVGYAKNKAQAPAEIDSETITGISPLKKQVEKTYSYRYIVKPNTTLSEITGEFQCFGIKKQYTIGSGKTVSQGKYKDFNVTVIDRYDVVGGTAVYTPKVGDYYLTTGAIMDGDYDLTDAEKALCMGIVYYTGTGINANGKTHGLIIGLNEISSTRWGTYGETSGVSTDQTKFNGYENTNYLKSNKSGYAIVSSYNTLKGQEATDTNNKTSGWYIPSVAEMKVFASAYATVNAKLQKIGKTQVSTSYYWSSTEYNNYNAYCVGLDNGNVIGNYKNDNYSLRLVSAF